MPSMPAKNWQNEVMDANRIPEDLAAAIAECWPDGVIEEFDTDESYFHDIRAKLERDLRKIPGASLLWQTPAEDDDASWDDDEPPPFGPEFQSYHVFFLAPQGGEFEFETETESLEEPEDPEDPEDPDSEMETVTYPGTEWYGCSVAVSLASPFASVFFSEHARFEDGSIRTPDPGDFAYSDETGERVDLAASYRKVLGESAFAKLENLRARIAKILAKHGVGVLDEAVLDLPAPGLRSDSEVFMSEPITVRDAFFFRGV
jgi:hypothetical protein